MLPAWARKGVLEEEMRMSANDMLRTALDWQAEGRKLAIATVVQTWGSAPQPTGSQLIIDGEGNFLGSVSGGCVEGEVITEAVEVIAGRHAETSGIRRAGRDRLARRSCLWRPHPYFRRAVHRRMMGSIDA